MTRFHDSRFQGVRLVCRLRRNSGASPAPGVPTGPAALTPAVAHTQTAFEAITQNREISSKALREAAAESLRAGELSVQVHDKYFIMKSLTVEDMELSVRNSIWATQAHNEDALNKAYDVRAHLTDNTFCAYIYRPRKTFTSYFQRTNRVNILVSPVWLLQSLKKRLRALTGLHEEKS